MYSGGDAYFNKTLKHFNQSSSYFATQNKHWTFVGLDVAFRDHSIDDEQVDWLKKVLAQAGDRKVILFSHHQLYSHFESQGERLWGHAGLAEILNSNRIFAWYWGHEHRCSIFEGKDPRFGIFARCIGHGGMPESRDATRDLPSAEESKYQDADWRRSPSQAKLGNVLPGCIVLEGSNPDILGEEDKFTPHGYAIITVEGPTLKEQVLTSTGKVIYSNYLVP